MHTCRLHTITTFSAAPAFGIILAFFQINFVIPCKASQEVQRSTSLALTHWGLLILLQNSSSWDMQTRRGGRLSAGRGLATQLEGMQAQLASLDAMWSTVNAPKSEAPSLETASSSEHPKLRLASCISGSDEQVLPEAGHVLLKLHQGSQHAESAEHLQCNGTFKAVHHLYHF